MSRHIPPEERKNIHYRSILAKAIDGHLQRTTHDNYPYGAHMFDILLSGRIDIFIARPGVYQNITNEDVHDYIKFRQTADQSVVREKEWLTGNPEQYLHGYLAKQWQIAGAIADQSLAPTALVSEGVISAANGESGAAPQHASG